MSGVGLGFKRRTFSGFLIFSELTPTVTVLDNDYTGGWFGVHLVLIFPKSGFF